MMILPIAAAIVLRILTRPFSEGISITGAQIFFTIPMPLQDLPITEAQINSVCVMIAILGLCLYMTHGLSEKAATRRQLLCEWVVEKTESMVRGSMGEFFKGYAPFIAAILALSALSSLLSLLGLNPPTSDINVVAGFFNYLKGFTEPIFIMAPLNVLGEVATPVSMAFRHYGNVLSGSVIGVLIATALQGLSDIVLGWLPGVLGDIPFLQIGVPAILSLYFDVFSGCMQAYIFAMLTMLNISGAFPQEEYEKRKQKKLLRKNKKLKINN